MSRRILLADDSVTIQKVIELTFMDEDYEVRAVSNGDEAVAALAGSAPDMVLADVHMPGASGYEVCRPTKELHPHVPVLLLVGTFEPFDEAKAREVGADSFLKKPFDSQELLQRVGELLGAGGREGRQPAAAAAPEPAPQPATGWEVSAAAPEPAPSWSAFDDDDLEPPPTEVMPPAYGEPFASQEGEPFRWEVEPEELAPEPFAEPEPAFAGRPIGFEAHPPATEEAAATASAAEVAEAAEAAAAPAELAIPAADEDIEAPLPLAAVAPAAAPDIDTPFPLSEADVDRIARRVAELLGERVVRDVAWEVVPDLAEVVIKERLRELESQVE